MQNGGLITLAIMIISSSLTDIGLKYHCFLSLCVLLWLLNGVGTFKSRFWPKTRVLGSEGQNMGLKVVNDCSVGLKSCETTRNTRNFFLLCCTLRKRGRSLGQPQARFFWVVKLGSQQAGFFLSGMKLDQPQVVFFWSCQLRPAAGGFFFGDLWT